MLVFNTSLNDCGQRVLEKYRSINDTNYSIDLRYIYGSFVDDVLGFYQGSYQFYYHHSDRQYNSRCLTDWARRAIEYTSYTPYGSRTIEYTSYTPYGSRTIDPRWSDKNSTTSVYGNTLGFTGRHYEKESGLYYFRARYYDSGQGRFISRDPAGYIDGMGLYNGYFASKFALDPSGKLFNSIESYVDISISVRNVQVNGINAFPDPDPSIFGTVTIANILASADIIISASYGCLDDGGIFSGDTILSSIFLPDVTIDAYQAVIPVRTNIPLIFLTRGVAVAFKLVRLGYTLVSVGDAIESIVEDLPEYIVLYNTVTKLADTLICDCEDE